MIFNEHYKLAGKHAILSASKYHWLNYSDEKFDDYFRTARAAQMGTELHALAAKLITLGIKLPRTHKTLNMYVNDGIGFKMQPEVTLYYSDNCFGTADTIMFKKDILRIHDLKTGVTPASMSQLDIYTALFCLEYNIEPTKIQIENHIYQNDEVEVRIPPPDDILYVMDRIVAFDRRIEKLKLGEINYG